MRGQPLSSHLISEAPHTVFRSPAPTPEPIEPPPWALVQEIPGKMYYCETVERITRHRRPKHRIWVIKSSIMLIVDTSGNVRRMTHIGSIDSVFVSERPSGCWRIIIMFVERANEPTQVIDLPLDKDPVPVLNVLNSIHVAHTGKGLPPVHQLLPTVEIHDDPDIYGPFEKDKIVNYLSPEKKKELWATERPNYKSRPVEKDEDKAESLEEKEVPQKSVFEESKSDSGEGDLMADEEKVTFDTIGASQLHLERRRRTQAERRAWKAEVAANALADQLSKRRLTSSSSVVVTNIRTEGIDSAIKKCKYCMHPYTPFCSVSGSRHDSDDLILTMFTVRQTQHVTGTSCGGVCNYDVAHWNPYPIAQDRIITFSVVSASQLLGKAGIIVTDLLPDDNSTTSPILWEQGVPMKLNGRPVGKLKIRCTLWDEDEHADSRWSLYKCVARSGQHTLHKLPGGDAVKTIKIHDRMIVEELTTINNELWGRVGSHWTIMKDSRGETYMRKVEHSRQELGRNMVTSCIIIAVFAVERPAKTEERASFMQLNSKLGLLERDVRKMEERFSTSAYTTSGTRNSGSAFTASTFVPNISNPNNNNVTNPNNADSGWGLNGYPVSQLSSTQSQPMYLSVRKVPPVNRGSSIGAESPNYVSDAVFQTPSPSPSRLPSTTPRLQSGYTPQVSHRSEVSEVSSVPVAATAPSATFRRPGPLFNDDDNDRIYITVHSDHHNIPSSYSSTSTNPMISL